MEIRADEISRIIRDQIKDYGKKVDVAETGTVLSQGDGIARRLEIERVVHIGTDEVYGSLRSDEPAFTELTPYSPNSPYSASKAASDHLVRAWGETYGLPVVVTNCSNNASSRSTNWRYIRGSRLRITSRPSSETSSSTPPCSVPRPSAISVKLASATRSRDESSSHQGAGAGSVRARRMATGGCGVRRDGAATIGRKQCPQHTTRPPPQTTP